MHDARAYKARPFMQSAVPFPEVPFRSHSEIKRRHRCVGAGVCLSRRISMKSWCLREVVECLAGQPAAVAVAADAAARVAKRL